MNVTKARGWLLFYRIMAWVVGLLLIGLVAGAVRKWFIDGDGTLVSLLGQPHGILYMVLIAATVGLGYYVRWPWHWYLIIALAGTVPFLSFVAEHFATKDVRRRVAAAEGDAPATPDAK